MTGNIIIRTGRYSKIPKKEVLYACRLSCTHGIQRRFRISYQREYNERYYEEMLNLVKGYEDYSVLGHMDLITRYDKEGIYPFKKVEPLVEEILRTVIETGKGIEFNTSYHRYGLKDTTPSMDILKLYQRLGGEIITIGSDSHKPEHLGAYIEEGKQLLQSLGFRFFCTYDKMKPVYHGL